MTSACKRAPLSQVTAVLTVDWATAFPGLDSEPVFAKIGAEIAAAALHSLRLPPAARHNFSIPCSSFPASPK